MTTDDFRAIALGLPEAVESAHMDHPDFRVGGKIFATLGYPDARFGVVKLTPDQQRGFVDAHPRVFVPAAGAWGARGMTSVLLSAAGKRLAREALNAAWCNTAPRKLLAQVEPAANATGDKGTKARRP